ASPADHLKAAVMPPQKVRIVSRGFDHASGGGSPKRGRLCVSSARRQKRLARNARNWRNCKPAGAGLAAQQPAIAGKGKAVFGIIHAELGEQLAFSAAEDAQPLAADATAKSVDEHGQRRTATFRGQSGSALQKRLPVGLRLESGPAWLESVNDEAPETDFKIKAGDR